MNALRFRHSGEGETVPFTGELTPMRAFVGAVDERCPVAAGALESKPFDKDVLHSLESMPREGTGAVFDELVLAIVTVVGVSKIEHIGFLVVGSWFLVKRLFGYQKPS